MMEDCTTERESSTTSRTGSDRSPDYNREEIERFLYAVIEEGAPFELRALNPSRSGFFEDIPTAAAEAARVRSDVYLVANPIAPSLLPRARNRIRYVGHGGATSDADVLRRRWFFVDVDPNRPPKTGATEVERAAAQRSAERIVEELDARGFPQPIEVDSGNGVHLWYRVDLPAADDIVERFLCALAARHDDDGAHVDTGVYNAARIMRLPGTWNRKGDDTPERPHRLARIVRQPDDALPAPRELLEEYIADHAPRVTTQPAATTTTTTTPVDEDTRARRARAWVDREPAAVQGQDGSGQTMRVAATVLRGYSLTRAVARDILTAYSSRCVPPWSAAEIEHKIDDAETKGRLQWGCMLDLPDDASPLDAEIALARAELASLTSDKPGPVAALECAADLLDVDEAPTPWAVAGLFTSPGFAMIGAEPKAGKTWTALEVALSVATGTAAFGEFSTGEPRPVALFLAEDQRRHVVRRLRALCAGKGLDPREALRRVHVVCMAAVNLADPGSAASVVARCRMLPESPAVVVLDPLRDMHRAAEDSSTEMEPVLSALRGLRTVLGCVVLAVHHTGKASESSRGRRPGQNLRGSSAIHGAIECGFYVGKTSEDDGGMELRVSTEVRGARCAGGFSLSLRIENDDRGEPTRASWSFSREGRRKADDASAKRAHTVVATLRRLHDDGDGPCTKSSLAREIGGNRQAALDAIEEAAAAGLVLVHDEERRRLFSYRPTADDKVAA